jgi:hypothetical protein
MEHGRKRSARLPNRCRNGKNEAMKLHIDEMHQGGVDLGDGRGKGVRVVYSIVDEDTGQAMTDLNFDSFEAAAAYVAEHFSVYERWMPPEPTAAELEELMRIVNWMEQSPADVDAVGQAGRGFHARLSYELHQRRHEVDVVARIKNLLDRFGQ